MRADKFRKMEKNNWKKNYADFLQQLRRKHIADTPIEGADTNYDYKRMWVGSPEMSCFCQCV